MVSVAIQGERGSYSEKAAETYFGRDKAKVVSLDTFREVFDRVERLGGYGVMPIYNTIEGIVTAACDLLLSRDLKVVGETVLRIEHCLIANKGVPLEGITKVYSHPQALAQCRTWLEHLGVEAIPFYDTAGSVKMISEKGLRDSAGIASQYAAEVYDMHVLRRNIETQDGNFTRFFTIAKQGKTVKNGEEAKTSIGFAVRSKPGALFMAMGCFAVNDVNMTYITSRPVAGKHMESGFYVECEGSIQDRSLKNAISSLRRTTDSVNVIGSYAPARQKVFR